MKYLKRQVGGGATSPSMAMASIYEKDMPSIQEYVKHFKLIDSQVGAIFMIDGKVVGLDSFGKPESFTVESRESIGLGKDLRIESRKNTGFALSLDDQILHLSVFARENGRAQGKYNPRMERYTQRRQNPVY